MKKKEIIKKIFSKLDSDEILTNKHLSDPKNWFDDGNEDELQETYNEYDDYNEWKDEFEDWSIDSYIHPDFESLYWKNNEVEFNSFEASDEAFYFMSVLTFNDKIIAWKITAA